MASDRLSCFISIWKFGTFKNPFATIASLFEIYFRLRRLILLVHTNKMIAMNYESSTSIMEMSGACIDICNEGYIHQF